MYHGKSRPSCENEKESEVEGLVDYEHLSRFLFRLYNTCNDKLDSVELPSSLELNEKRF